MRAPDVKREASMSEQRLYYFDNGYGASVIRTALSYGGDEGKWEVAVLKKTPGKGWPLCYDTPITSDVIGWLSEEGVDALLVEIEKLPKEEEG